MGMKVTCAALPCGAGRDTPVRAASPQQRIETNAQGVSVPIVGSASISLGSTADFANYEPKASKLSIYNLITIVVIMTIC